MRNASRAGLQRALANSVPKPMRPVARWLWSNLSRLKAHSRRLSAAGRPHQLPGELIISLTSYPARFRTLHLSLRCLLTQSIKPDRIVLWIAREDLPLLPASVRKLAAHGI